VEMIREHRLNRWWWRRAPPHHEPVFRETLARIGFNPYLLEMATSGTSARGSTPATGSRPRTRLAR